MADWRVDFLKGAGFPVTAQNLLFLASWQAHESGGSSLNAMRERAAGNFFNIAYTSLPEEVRRQTGAYVLLTSSNGTQIAGFKGGPAAGGLAWGTYLRRSGHYPNVITGLSKGNPFNPTYRQGILGDLSVWVQGSRTGNLGYGASILGASKVSFGTAAGIAQETGTKQTAGNFFGTGVGAIDKPVGKAVDVISAPYDALKWAVSNWDRVLEVAGGFVLVLVGLILMGRSLGVTKTKIELVEKAGRFTGEREYARAGSPAPAKRDRSLSRRTKTALPADTRAPRAGEPGSSQLGPDEELPF